MGSVRLQNVTKQFGPRVVLDDATLEFHTGQIAALVGANGAGKTTVFRLIAGQLAPDMGTVTPSRGLPVGYLPQEPDVAAGATLRAAVAEASADLMALERRLQELSEQIAAAHDAPHVDDLLREYDRLSARFEAAGGYTFEQRLHGVLGGLGFTPAEYELPMAALSGGQKCRAALAKLLLRAAAGPGEGQPFLLLDEPTNHLDIDAVRWLERFLAGHHGGAVIISHDRYLLDRLAERTIECVGGKLYSYPGNYSNFVQARDVQRLAQQRQFEQDQEYIAKERDYVARYHAAQRGRQARGRLTRLERRLAAGEFTLQRPAEQSTNKLSFGPAAESSRRWSSREMVRLIGVHKQYGDKVLFTNLDLEVYHGQRLAITGPNGTGKTTLLRILLGQVAAETGTVRMSSAVRVGYFAQESTGLDPNKTVIEEICTVRPDLLERDARHVAARFLFVDEEPFKRVGQLSGGEQSRVRFMKLILTAPEMLILDEPTNHLDIPSREALEAALLEFAGTIIAVSHDRYFLDRIADRLLVIRPEGHHLVHGNYSKYIEQVEEARAAEEAARDAARAAELAAKKKVSRPRSGAGRGTGTAGPRSPFAKLKLEELETFIHDREQRLAKLQERFGDPQIYKDVAALAELREAYESLKAELSAAEEAWMERMGDA